MKKPKQLRLISSDFISLETEKCRAKCRRLTSGQFVDSRDCPIARAAKRMGLKNVSVISSEIKHSKGVIKIEGQSSKVGRVAYNIQKGAKYGIIKILN